MKTIRVLHVLYGMELAGTETLLMNIYRNIDKSKVQFDFAVCAGKKCAYDDEIISLGGRIIEYPRYKLINHFVYLKWWNEFFKNHSEYKIIHGHIGSTASIYLSIAKKYGCYAIAHSHSTKMKGFNAKKLIYYIYSTPTRWIADYFMGCSKNALIDRYGKKVAHDKDRSRVLLNAIDIEKFVYNEAIRREVRIEYNIGNDELVIGTIGRLTFSKNPYAIIDIISELKKKGLKFVFLWIGEGELENVIKEKIYKMGLNNFVIMPGVRKDVNRIIQAMDIFIFPSLWEGLGIACIEAQTSGLPTLCSSEIPEEAKITKNCKYLPINNTNTWVQEILNLVSGGFENRKDCRECVKEAGYDIKEQTAWLEDFYINREKVGFENDC